MFSPRFRSPERLLVPVVPVAPLGLDIYRLDSLPRDGLVPYARERVRWDHWDQTLRASNLNWDHH